MKKILILTLCVLLSGCKLLKNVDKKDSTSDLNEKITEKTVRKGDTVTYIVPRIRYKDTTITTINHVGSRIETRYDDQGNIDLINCFSSEIDLLREEIRSLRETEREKVKEENAKPDPWFWLVIILASGVVLWVVKKF